jgi:hypothetical protein
VSSITNLRVDTSKMDSNVNTIVAIATALIVVSSAVLVAVLNQRHRTLEKRLDDLYSPLCHYAWLPDREKFPKHGEHDYVELLHLLHSKNYLMTSNLLHFYVGYVLATKPSDDAFIGNRQDEFIRIVRADYEMIRRQYLSFWNLLKGLINPDILGYKPTLEK